MFSLALAEGSIVARNASGTVTTSFFTTDPVYGASFELFCRNTSHYGTWVTMKGARVSLYLVPYWPFWPDEYSDPPFSLSNYLIKFSTNANSSGYVPNHILTSGLPAGEYKLVLTFSDSDDNFRMNRQVSSSINCTDVVFPVVGGSPPMITSSAPPVCTGSIGLSGMPGSATLGQSVPVTVSGISNCAGKTIYVKNGSCNGATLSSFTSGSTGGSTTFAAPGPIGSRLIYVCSDLDGNGDFGGGEATFWSLGVTSGVGCSGTMSMTLSPDSIIPASIVTVNLAGFSGCNTPIYIKNGSCSGSTLQTFTEMPNGGMNSFIPLLGNGSHSLYACADFNGNTQFDAGEYASDVLTIGTGGPQQGCTGAIDLDLSASTANINQKIYYNISGYSNCGGRTVYLRKGFCSGALVASYSAATEIYEAYVGYQNYFNVTSTGPYAYFACLDMNNDGDYDDAGEVDSKSLAVDGGGDQTCDSTHCSSCANLTSCSAANCLWTAGGVCVTNMGPQCFPCGSCQNLTSCISNSCYWCNGVCQTAQCPGPQNCSSNNFAACVFETACLNVGGHWCNGLCQAAECPAVATCSHNDCSACKKAGICSDENCYWYEDACHLEPQQISGNLTITLPNTEVQPGTQVFGNIYGASGYDSAPAQIKQISCNGTVISNCMILNGTCGFNFTSQELAGELPLVACIDANGDGSYEKTTEATPTLLMIKTPPGGQDLLLIAIVGISAIAAGFLGPFLYTKRKPAVPRPTLPQKPKQDEPKLAADKTKQKKSKTKTPF